MGNQKEIGEEQGDEYADLMLEGEMVDNLTSKYFKILNARQVVGEDLDNPTLQKKKIILLVQLHDGTKIEMYCNKTSQKAIARVRGVLLKNWIGYESEFMTTSMMVNGKEKKCIFIK